MALLSPALAQETVDENTWAEQAVEAPAGMTPAEKEPTCFDQWNKMFELRGTNKIEDGTYKNVIVSVRKDENAECFVGKVFVRKGMVEHIYAMVEGGGYELFIKKYRSDSPWDVRNGISSPRITSDDEIVNVLFIDQLKPKKKPYVKAPLPTMD